LGVGLCDAKNGKGVHHADIFLSIQRKSGTAGRMIAAVNPFFFVLRVAGRKIAAKKGNCLLTITSNGPVFRV